MTPGTGVFAAAADTAGIRRGGAVDDCANLRDTSRAGRGTEASGARPTTVAGAGSWSSTAVSF